MRIARRRRLPAPPTQVWRRLADPRDWAPLFITPEAAPPRRVKSLDDARGPVAGTRLQVLRTDHTWTRYEVLQWDPERQVRLRAETTGQGQEPGTPVAGVQVERLILIPQGGETEAEWTVDRRGALLTRLLSEKGRDPWIDALDARLEVLAQRAGLPPPT